MPELPEVQTVASQIDAHIAGKIIQSFWTDWSKKILSPLPGFKKKISGATILSARRIGKHIVIELDNDYSIVAHLKMTGHFLYKTPSTKDSAIFTEDPKNGFIHHIFTFTDGSTLEFSDMRKFGWLRILLTKEVEELKSIQTLGIDALSPKLTVSKLKEIYKKRGHRAIGETLLEQNLVAGIGNIYRSEALFLAGVLPTRRGESLTDDEWKLLLLSIKKVLRHAVRLHGTSDGDFRDLFGFPGRFQRTLYVYQRHGEPCKKCGTIIVRKKLGSRSIFFCPQCQK
jgi:formamidopyrimidine-DNA glycosylase